MTRGNPWHLTTVELLLQGGPWEFLPEWSADQGGNPNVRSGVSDRALMVEAAERWATNLTLNEEERDRIRAVWLNGERRPPYNLDTGRRDHVRSLLQRVSV